MSIERRTFLRGSMAVAGGILAGGPFQGVVARDAMAEPKGNAPFRALRPIPDARDGKVRLHLPEGFSYRSFHDTEFPVVLRDGTKLPGRHDGMGAFRGSGGNVLLVRNHELNSPGAPFGPGTPYDANAQGGTTTVEVTPFGEVRDAYTSLNGTMMNCSGGIMPWGSWITCEETVNGPDVGPDFTGTPNLALTKPHGFIFEVPAGGQSNRQPITRAGRFAHEAVAFDPADGILYLTEDNFAFPSGFYRYRPASNPLRSGRLDNNGRLQMLAVRGRPNLNLAAEQPKRATYDVEWVDIDDPAPTFPYTPGQTAPTTNDQALVYVGDQGRSQGAAYFSRLEGTVYDKNVVYFCSTQGGGPAETGPDSVNGYGNGFGQIWGYHTRAEKLQLLYQSPNRSTLDFPDNVTTSPRGTLVLCEDSTQDNYLRGLSRGGQLWDIALNRLTSSTGVDRSGDEFAGSTFSPDGHTLFVNIQASRGMSFAIWGPWQRIGV
ncbi:alkaline phosphatase PhoX [Kribbella sp. NPDC023855]|uniref:PhoX family protein n=1 Tax=Kribbella sp. NPDC023855 TaxID=3154698 RepID=UPI0033F3B2B2